MKDVPNKLQCAYCIRNHVHGGECTSQRSAYDEKGCLIFKLDERGCIRNSDLRLAVPLYYDFPPLKTWCEDWQYHGVDTSLKIERIYGLGWNAKKGHLVVHCDCYYFVNEFHDDFKETPQKPILSLVRNT